MKEVKKLKELKIWVGKANSLFTYFSSDLCVGNSRAAAEITELPIVINATKDVLRLDISMNDRWLLHMHLNKALDDMRGNQEHLALLQALLPLISTRLDQVEQVSARA